MLATDCYSNYYTNSNIYENEWMDNHSIRIPWLNFLTAQSIPEETEFADYSTRSRNNSVCSSSSLEDSYIVLDVQPTYAIAEQELNFAQINEEEDQAECEELDQSMAVEVLSEEYVVEPQLEQAAHISDNILLHTTTDLDKSISLFDDDSLNISKHKFNEHHSLLISSTSLELQSLITSPTSTKDSSPSSTTFSHHRSLQRKLNPIQMQRETSAIEQAPLTRIFTEKNSRVKANYIKETTIHPCDFDNKSNNLSKKSALIRLIKKRNRTIKSDCYLSRNDIKPNEPSLIQVKYFDGRPTLLDTNAQKSQFSTISSTHLSYRKRIFNRFQTLLKPSSIDQSKAGQHKTVFELFNQRKSKTNRY